MLIDDFDGTKSQNGCPTSNFKPQIVNRGLLFVVNIAYGILKLHVNKNLKQSSSTYNAMCPADYAPNKTN